MQKIKTIFSNIPRFFNSVYFIFLIFIILLITFGVYVIAPVYFPEYENLNLLYFVVSAALVVGISVVLYKTKIGKVLTKKFNRKRTYLFWFVVLVFVLLLCNYLLFANYIYSPVGDTNAVNFNMFQNIDSVLYGNLEQDSSFDAQYALVLRQHLEDHRNLLFITGLYKQLYDLLSNFDLSFLTISLNFMEVQNSKGLDVYAACEWISCFCVDGAIILCVLSIKKLTNGFISLLAFAFMILLTALSPNAISTYTDPFSLLIVSLMFFLYVCVKNKLVKCILYPFLFIVGYNIKPTTVAIGLAILVVEFCKWVGKNKDFKGAIKQLPSNITKASFWKDAKNYIVFVVMIPLTLFVTSSVSSFGIEINQSKQLPFTHYLMLGLDSINDGRYFSGDEYLTTSYETNEEKIQANLDVIGRRLFNKPVYETLILFGKKAIIANGSGSFKPVEYYYFTQPHKENPLLTSIYGAGVETEEELSNLTGRSDGYFAYNVMTQILWFMALIGSLAFLYKKRKDPRIYVLTLSLLMINVYLLFFEDNERYMFLYSLLPVILMSCYFYAVQQGEYELSVKKLASDLSPKKVFKRRKKAEKSEASENEEKPDEAANNSKNKKKPKLSNSKKSAKTTKSNKTSKPTKVSKTSKAKKRQSKS